MKKLKLLVTVIFCVASVQAFSQGAKKITQQVVKAGGNVLKTTAVKNVSNRVVTAAAKEAQAVVNASKYLGNFDLPGSPTYEQLFPNPSLKVVPLPEMPYPGAQLISSAVSSAVEKPILDVESFFKVAQKNGASFFVYDRALNKSFEAAKAPKSFDFLNSTGSITHVAQGGYVVKIESKNGTTFYKAFQSSEALYKTYERVKLPQADPHRPGKMVEETFPPVSVPEIPFASQH